VLTIDIRHVGGGVISNAAQRRAGVGMPVPFGFLAEYRLTLMRCGETNPQI
jgi:hypothetical protein